MYKLFYSPILRTFFQKLSENKISQEILNKENSLIDINMTCIELDTEGYLSFSPADKVEKLLKDQRRRDLNDWDSLENFWYHDMINSDSTYGIWTKSRNQLKIGRFINQLFPDKYTTKEVEDFVNLVKSKQNINDEFQLISGEDIRYWYNDYKYYSNCGDLGNSCMRNEVCQPFFNIYVKNPKCQMLILKRDNLLVGRALIWHINYTGEEFSFEYMMDRVYTNKPSDILKFHEYAKEKGWARKYKNSYSDEYSFVVNEKRYDAKVGFQLEINEYETYPYVDTYKFYNPTTGIIQNYAPDERGFYKLESTHGSYTKWQLRKHSDYYQTTIAESEAIWSERLQDWLYRDETVEVTVGSLEYRGIYPDDHDDIRFDPNLSKYVHNSDCVYSDYYGEYIFKENAEKVYIINSNYQVRRIDWTCINNLKTAKFVEEITNEKFIELKPTLDSAIKLVIITRYD